MSLSSLSSKIKRQVSFSVPNADDSKAIVFSDYIDVIDRLFNAVKSEQQCRMNYDRLWSTLISEEHQARAAANEAVASTILYDGEEDTTKQEVVELALALQKLCIDEDIVDLPRTQVLQHMFENEA